MHSLEDVRKELEKINVQLAVYNASLEEHMRRTALLETAIEKHSKVYDAVEFGFKIMVVLGILTTILKNMGVI